MKYELIKEDFKEILGVKLFRIRYTETRELGGYIEKVENLSVSGDAQVWGNAQVSGDAQVSGNARVSGDAQVWGNAQVSGNARVSGDAQVSGNARVSGDAQVSGNAQVWGDAQVSGDAQVQQANEILMIGPLGSRNAMLSIFFDKDKNLLVSTGCFLGTPKEFLIQVKDRYGKEGFGKDYLDAIKYAETKLKNVKKANSK